MILRDGADSRLVDKFGGVNDAIDSIRLSDMYVEWSQGCSVTDQQTLKRILGKKAFDDNGTYAGRILSIQELEFHERKVVVWHTSSLYQITTTVSGLRVANASTITRDEFIHD